MAIAYFARMTRLLSVAVACVSVACAQFPGQRVPYVTYFRQLPPTATNDWLGDRRLSMTPFVSGSVHTPSTLGIMPQRFGAMYPMTASYRPLWARERDAAAYLHGEILSAIRRRLPVFPSRVTLLPGADSRELNRYYQASAHLEQGAFRAVLFDRRAMDLGEDSDGSDRMAPFRKAFIYEKDAPPGRSLRIVTGYLGLHCVHELVGRHRKDRASTRIDWLFALVDSDSSVLAQAYVGASNDEWICPVSGERWRELVDSLADQFIAAIVLPHPKP